MVAGYVMTGGRNSRMGGEKKLFLKLGGRTFLEYILETMQDFSKIYLSVERTEPYEHLGIPMIVDQIAGIGPIGGICSGLRACEEDAIFVIACDMPFVSREAVKLVLEGYRRAEHSVVGMAGGKIHPLFGIYTKELLPLVEEQIANGNYRLIDLIQRADIRTVNLDKEEGALTNINTREEYDTVRGSTETIIKACGGDR